MRPRGMPHEEEPPSDPTGWLLSGTVAEFLLLYTAEIKYMCLLGYAFLHGNKVFSNIAVDSSLPYKFVNLVLASTGGGTLVPIFINSIPVSLSQDAYPVAIIVSFLLHQYVPILREILGLSAILKAAMIVMFETIRASVVVKWTAAAAAAIPPSEFSFPLFGPIFCGAIAGCGGVFLPFDKGLVPLMEGLAPNMITALVAATFYHLFLSTSLSDGVVSADKKAHLMVAEFFIVYSLVMEFPILKKGTKMPPAAEKKIKTEKKKV